MSLSSTYISRKQLIADNLNSMGVDSADVSDGLTTLANKILDIEPSIHGLVLDTSVSIVSSASSVTIGDSVVFTSVLSASYDDTSSTDVDLSGVLTGATVEFYNDYTFLGSGVTGSDGVATFSHVFDECRVYNIRAVFAGSNNFDSCVSSVISVTVNYNLTVSADKSILSFNDGDVATVTASLDDNVGGVIGETLSYELLDKADNVLDSGSDITDSNGEINFTYASTGVGDVRIIVTYGLLQETYELEDCQFYDSFTSNSGHWSIPSDVTLGYNEYSSDGWKFGYASRFIGIPSDFHVTFPFKLSFVLKDRYSYTPQLNISEKYIEFGYNRIEIQGTRLPHFPINGAEYSFIIRSDSVEAYCNNNLVGSVNVSFDPTDTNLRLATGGNRYCQIKDLKVKAL